MGGRGSGRKPAKQVTLANDREPYERQDFERDPAWRGFLAYRDLGPDRTIVAAVKARGKTPGYQSTMEAWSCKHAWVVRCAAWDRHVDDISREAQLKAVAKKAGQMAKVAEGLWLLAGKDLELWHAKLAKARRQAAARARNRGKDPSEEVPAPMLTVKEIEALASAGIKLTRMLDDQPSEITEQRMTSLADLARAAKKEE